MSVRSIRCRAPEAQPAFSRILHLLHSQQEAKKAPSGMVAAPLQSSKKKVAMRLTPGIPYLGMQFLAIWTTMQFGWRIFSRLAVDFRKKDAHERKRLYLSRALFLTVEKLDLQFLVRCSQCHGPGPISRCRLPTPRSYRGAQGCNTSRDG